MAGLHFELVSPERIEYVGTPGMVVIPGVDGLFGVLLGHAPFMSLLKAGVIDLYEEGKVVRRFFVTGGFAEVRSEGCTVLADEAMPVEDLDIEVIENKISALTAASGNGAPTLMDGGIQFGPLAVYMAMLEAAREAKNASR